MDQSELSIEQSRPIRGQGISTCCRPSSEAAAVHNIEHSAAVKQLLDVDRLATKHQVQSEWPVKEIQKH